MAVGGAGKAPVNVGVVSFVRLSVLSASLSLAASRSGAGGAAGASVSTVIESDAESGDSDRPGKVWRAVITRAPSARDDEHVERRAGFERDVGKDAQPSGRHHRFGALGDQHDLERRGFLAAPRLVEASHGKDLEGTAEVQYLDLFIDQNSDPLALHERLRTQVNQRSWVVTRETTMP